MNSDEFGVPADVRESAPVTTILRNARFYVGSDWAPDVDAVAVADGRIVAVGSELSRAGASVVDLDGAYVLPGFQDAHVHPVQGGMELNRCNLAGLRTRQDYVAAIVAYATANPGVEWILGGGWSMDAFERGTPTADVLDAVLPDRPVFLPNRDHHSAWVNSRALQLAGITAATPDPPDGRIERDASGEPTGALHEGAMSLVALPEPSADEIRDGLLMAQAYLHSLGITGWQDALVGTGLSMPDTLDTYCALASSGALTARVVGALWWDRERGEEQVDELLSRRARASAAGLDMSSVKIMQDGVCETYTAAVLDAYRDEHGHATDNHGIAFIEPAALARYVTRLDRDGFQAHIHALGDRAVRDALDAIAAARAANGGSGLRHHLAHLQLVDPADVARFAELDVTANVQMLWACNDKQMSELTLPFLSPAARSRQYMFRSLLDAGARLAGGSDWPVSTPDPFAAMHVAVNRLAPPAESESDVPLLPDEALPVRAVIDAFTRGAAYVNRLDDCGAIAVGNRADFTVVDRDVLAIPSEELASVRPVRTVVGGETVWTS